jgi:GTP diphosphokinase / guanosine-3',5'-bis(diphosphate) 3'-diphosphatase
VVRLKEDEDFLIWIWNNHSREGDAKRILKAWRYASRSHFQQLRRTIRPYICHPIEVAKKAKELDLPLEYEEAGLLHDTTEDCLQTILEICSMFGPAVALLVLFMDKKKLCFFENHKDKSNFFYEIDPRTIILRLIDSWSNLKEASGYKSVISRKRAAWDALDLLETARELFPGDRKYFEFFEEVKTESKKYS